MGSVAELQRCGSPIRSPRPHPRPRHPTASYPGHAPGSSRTMRVPADVTSVVATRPPARRRGRRSPSSAAPPPRHTTTSDRARSCIGIADCPSDVTRSARPGTRRRCRGRSLGCWPARPDRTRRRVGGDAGVLPAARAGPRPMLVIVGATAADWTSGAGAAPRFAFPGICGSPCTDRPGPCNRGGVGRSPPPYARLGLARPLRCRGATQEPDGRATLTTHRRRATA